MNSTSAVEVSIQAVSPELIFEESTENGSVGAAGAASDAPDAGAAAEAASADEDIAVLALTGDAGAGALAAVASDAGADAAAGADASWARATPTLAPISDPAINKDINNLRILLFPLIAEFLLRERPRRSRRCEYE